MGAGGGTNHTLNWRDGWVTECRRNLVACPRSQGPFSAWPAFQGEEKESLGWQSSTLNPSGVSTGQGQPQVTGLPHRVGPCACERKQQRESSGLPPSVMGSHRPTALRNHWWQQNLPAPNSSSVWTVHSGNWAAPLEGGRLGPYHIITQRDASFPLAQWTNKSGARTNNTIDRWPRCGMFRHPASLAPLPCRQCFGGTSSRPSFLSHTADQSPRWTAPWWNFDLPKCQFITNEWASTDKAVERGSKTNILQKRAAPLQLSVPLPSTKGNIEWPESSICMQGVPTPNPRGDRTWEQPRGLYTASSW